MKFTVTFDISLDDMGRILFEWKNRFGYIPNIKETTDYIHAKIRNGFIHEINEIYCQLKNNGVTDHDIDTRFLAGREDALLRFGKRAFYDNKDIVDCAFLDENDKCTCPLFSNYGDKCRLKDKLTCSHHAPRTKPEMLPIEITLVNELFTCAIDELRDMFTKSCVKLIAPDATELLRKKLYKLDDTRNKVLSILRKTTEVVS